MKLIAQEDDLGCGIACSAVIAGISYQEALNLFENGKERATKNGFYCKEIVIVMKNLGLIYQFKYIKKHIKYRIYKPNTIVYIKKSKQYPLGHYLVRTENMWIDPWINFPNINRKAGFRKRLPGKPIYIIFKST